MSIRFADYGVSYLDILPNTRWDSHSKLYKPCAECCMRWHRQTDICNWSPILSSLKPFETDWYTPELVCGILKARLIRKVRQNSLVMSARRGFIQEKNHSRFDYGTSGEIYVVIYACCDGRSSKETKRSIKETRRCQRQLIDSNERHGSGSGDSVRRCSISHITYSVDLIVHTRHLPISNTSETL